jgi:hypothetical protein
MIDRSAYRPFQARTVCDGCGFPYPHCRCHFDEVQG